MRKVWVIEVMFPEVPGRWDPVAACAITRDDARKKIPEWRRNCGPGCRVRVRKYYCYIPRRERGEGGEDG